MSCSDEIKKGLPKIISVKAGDGTQVGVVEAGTLLGDALVGYFYLTKADPTAAECIQRAFAMMVAGQIAAKKTIKETLINDNITIDSEGKLTLTPTFIKKECVRIDIV